MAYINPAPGTANAVTLTLDVASSDSDITQGVGALAIPALQDVTVNAANDVFTWSQLDSTAKKQVATTSTNSISMNVVVDTATFFGTVVGAAITGTIAEQGLFGCSRNKTLINFIIRIENSTVDTFIKGVGYITGLAPTVNADSPVWVSPVTITVSGEYTVAAT
ncbi:hypothetical protein UFOVP1634_15 [uncultured Caudovirales phage]|uniref:Uncharacterized protein n=1 Tax=uncultured Caudovirales phage TaxID=2100421 RepID=A0A6J5Q8N7_9CAUD|nr:hypothetical protein UFOVP1030_26 [uncultured Caudovirales phage]CAB4220310.1 hypothetical protein UFOVP1634_15 [uncultured Caudovirales phage]